MTDTSVAEHLQLGDHLCTFIDDADDAPDVMAQTVAAGLTAGDKVMVFTEALAPPAVLASLETRGIATSAAQRTGQVQVLPAREAYLSAGRFEAARMLHDLERHIEQADREGYRGLRVVGDMSWALTEPVGVDQLPGYETQVNNLFTGERALAVCLYDRRAFPRDLLRQVTSAHPTSAGSGVETGWAPLLRLRRTTDPYGLRLIGEADLSNRQSVVAVLNAVLEQQPDVSVPIVIDAAGLRFADTTTAALLGQLAVRAPAGLHLARPQAALMTILDHLGLTQLPELRLTRSADDAGRSRTEIVA